MKFSIVLNTRGRPFMLGNCIDSVFDTALHPNDVQFYIRHDIDDIKTLNFSNKKRKNVNFVMGERPVSLHGALNSMCKTAQSDYLWILNDDCHIATQNWDQIFLDKISKFDANDGIIYAATSDTSVDKPMGRGYSSFPLISKKAFDVLGYFMHESFVSLGGDSHLDRVYKAIDRVVDCKEIVVDHLTHNTIERVMNPDKEAQEYRARYAANFVDPFTYDISNDVLKLQNYIQGFDDEINRYGQEQT